MGTWGAGNFQNDGALDYLSEITESLADEIERILDGGTTADADEDGESRLMPAVAMLVVLCEHCNGAPPKADRISGWRERYLAAYDRSMPGLDPAGSFMEERRAVILSTFASLQDRSKGFWSH